MYEGNEMKRQGVGEGIKLPSLEIDFQNVDVRMSCGRCGWCARTVLTHERIQRARFGIVACCVGVEVCYPVRLEERCMIPANPNNPESGLDAE